VDNACSKQKQNGQQKPRFVSVSESKNLRIQQGDAVPENTNKAMKFGLEPSFQRIEEIY